VLMLIYDELNEPTAARTAMDRFVECTRLYSARAEQMLEYVPSDAATELDETWHTIHRTGLPAIEVAVRYISVDSDLPLVLEDVDPADFGDSQRQAT